MKLDPKQIPAAPASRPITPAAPAAAPGAAHTNPANRLPANTRHRNGMRGKSMKC